ncbi:MAG: acyl-CoA thioesterase [Gemmatimonadetes bacterium]|nr:acyl-CoA thioesterase [Gemmatimonadota bacterium]
MTNRQPTAQFGEMTIRPHVFESRFRVRSYELDSFAHVNHSVFLNWFEQARFDAFEQAGFPWPEIQARGWGVYVVKLEIEYLKEARLGDELVVRTQVAELGRTSMLFHQVASAAGTPEIASAEARVRAVFIGSDRRPARIPAEVRTALCGS